jgi:hypothetical protein
MFGNEWVGDAVQVVVGNGAGRNRKIVGVGDGRGWVRADRVLDRLGKLVGRVCSQNSRRCSGLMMRS